MNPPAPTLTSDVADRIREAVDRLEPTLVELRRDLHAHPELSWQEKRTTARVAACLQEAGIAVRRLPGTGLIADLGDPAAARRIALRADLDALPVADRTGLACASTVEGVAHACGHDVHTAAVLGAGLALRTVEDELRSRGVAVRLLFQPAEERVPGGAHHVMEHGGLDGVDEVYAVHCDPAVDVGRVGLVEGPITAACDALTVTLGGRGGHTSRPHLTQDLVYALGKVLTDVPAVLARRLDPRAGAALVWGRVESGIAPNVIPAAGSASGTLRVLDVDVWRDLGERVEKVVHEVAAPYDVTVHTEYVRGVPPVVNSAGPVRALAWAATRVIGADAVVPTRQSMGGEDFSWYLGSVPGAMARLGTRSPGGPTYELHQGDLTVDEAAITHGASLLAAVALHGPDAAGAVPLA